MKQCYEIAYAYYKNKNGQMGWAASGPRLLHNTLNNRGLWRFVKPVNTFCPIWYKNIDLYFTDYNLPTESYCTHFYTSAWSKEDKIKEFPVNTLIGRLKEKYLD